MDRLKAGLSLNIAIMVYLDDICSEDFERHLDNFKWVFHKLKKKLKINCQGHIFTKDDIATDPEKSATIKL